MRYIACCTRRRLRASKGSLSAVRLAREVSGSSAKMIERRRASSSSLVATRDRLWDVRRGLESSTNQCSCSSLRAPYRQLSASELTPSSSPPLLAHLTLTFLALRRVGMFAVCRRALGRSSTLRQPLTLGCSSWRTSPASFSRLNSTSTAIRLHQPSVKQLYDDAVKYEVSSGLGEASSSRPHSLSTSQNAVISSSGALMASSGPKTGRSPKDKRLVREETSETAVWVRAPLSLSLHST